METLSLTVDSPDVLADRLFESAVATFDLFSVYLGDKLGYYRTLAEHGELTHAELAVLTNTNERYAREWLEQQVASSILQVDDPSKPQAERRFRLPEGYGAVLASEDDLSFLPPLAQVVVGALHPLKQLVDAYQTGNGVPYADYGVDLVDGQGRMNRNFFLQQLGPEYLAEIPGLSEKLESGGRIADVGCGVGWSSIGLAKAFPGVHVDGFDLDELSVERAQANVRQFGVSDRVSFRLQDISDPDLAGQYDLVIAVECVHDMGDPVAALRTMKRLAKQDGLVLVVDERTAESLTPNADLLERLFYGFSAFHCLPVGIADCPEHSCAATGTVMRTETLRNYAKEAGFRDLEVLPLDYDLFRFYRLVR